MNTTTNEYERLGRELADAHGSIEEARKVLGLDPMARLEELAEEAEDRLDQLRGVSAEPGWWDEIHDAASELAAMASEAIQLEYQIEDEAAEAAAE